MSSPYVYGASNLQPNPYQTPYPDYYPYQKPSPFLPPVDIVGDHRPSPYRSSSPLPHTEAAFERQPNTTNAVPFPGSYDVGYQQPYQRQRAPSHHASPFFPPTTSPHVPLMSNTSRRHSFSSPSYLPVGTVPGAAYPGVSPWAGLANPLPGTFGNLVSTPIALHPFLDGTTTQSNFMFNLASQLYAPMQYLPSGIQVPLAPDVMSQPATHPSIYRLTILIEQLPDWPITLEYGSGPFRQQTGVSPSHPPPITVGDVLSRIHKELHERISKNDWARLNDRKKQKVTHSYAARCASVPTMEHLLRSDGIKKVDYLLDEAWFRGLTRTSDSKPEVLMLVVSRRPN